MTNETLLAMYSSLVIALTAFYFNSETIATFRTNFHVIRLDLCNQTQGLIQFLGNITNENDNCFLTASIRSPMPVDENVGVCIKIESKIAGRYVEMFTIREKDACKSGNIYGGEFWYDIERAAQLIQGQCPIRAGRHEVHHHRIDFQKMSLQTFPFGQLRFTGGLVDNKHHKEFLLCLVLEVENIPN